MIVFLYIGVYLTPILSIIFCLNLVTIMKKIKRDEKNSHQHVLVDTFFHFDRMDTRDDHISWLRMTIIKKEENP
ncbi:hypothetical protein [Rossellomorea marisflavi]|uniref:hypothetical protein n=1 Tax=Rossellomorea marisflavi TaxID=189381 RepID=UPI00345B13D6